MSKNAGTWLAKLPLLPRLRFASGIHRRSVQAPVSQQALTSSTDGGLRVTIHESVHAVDPATWDAVTGDGAITRSHAYLAAIENAGIDGCRYFYPVIHDASGTLVAHATVYLVRTDFAQLAPAWSQRAIAAVRRLWPDFLTARITECAVPLFSGCSVAHVAGASRAEVLARVEDATAEIARAHGSRLLVLRDFFGDELGEQQFLLARGYKCVSNLPLARIRVRWASYAEYLGSMRSRYRKDIMRRLRLAQQSGRVVEVLDEFGHDAAAWAAQARVIYERAQGFKRESVNAGYYRELDRRLGANSKLLVVRHEGRRIAHGMVLFDGVQTIATFFGRDRGPAGGEWFLLMNEVIRLGLERGSRYISLGLGSYDAKSLVGADIEPLYVYTRCTNRVLNAIIRLVPDLMQAPPVPERRLFHETRPGAVPGADDRRREQIEA